MLKILGGQFRSRRLKTPRDNDITRPWTGRARESVANQLRGHLQDAVVLDLFAGVGTMGLEAISRGAKTAIMVEKDRKIFSILEENIKNLDCSTKAIALQADALSSIPLLRVPRPVDIVFIDPPYIMMSQDSLRRRILEQIANIEPLLSSDGFIVLRTPVSPIQTDHSIEQLEGPEIHKEGSGMWILFYGKKVAA
ncbi:MAG: 16S rRNA (guanine(966)-N(2))-methyltransferase RsmD [Phycisphaerales bacterium]|nr:16S rRNA (guanine(966)-N(2))-methyltransferase RsmD [Planctomycetota bacterium]MBL6997925.1 16S rRNA (guanine(966)-N(2))-methyltransferase RsmD [Phycisphaerales bacterium]